MRKSHPPYFSRCRALYGCVYLACLCVAASAFCAPHWERVPEMTTKMYPFLMSRDLSLYVGGDGFLYRSTTNGGSWDVVHEGSYFRAMAESAEYLFASDGWQVWRSRDYGGTWEEAGGRFTYVRALLVQGPYIFAGGVEGIGTLYRADAHGELWEKVADFPSAVLALATLDDYVYCGTNGHDVGSAWRSSDWGDTWSEVPGTGIVNALAVYRGDLYAGGVTVHRFDDGSATWSRVGLPTTPVASITTAGAAIFAGGRGVHYSVDGYNWLTYTGDTGDIGRYGLKLCMGRNEQAAYPWWM